MELKTVSEREEYEAIERIYNASFPDNERAPMRLLKKRAARGKADFLAIRDGGEVAGMAYCVCCRDLAYLFYIAVDKARRGRGVGTQAMTALLERYRGKRFFLALEQLDKTAENYAQRVKRHEFYLGCGLYDLPFRLKEGEVIFAAMGAKLSENGSQTESITVRPEEYKELMSKYMGFIMRRFFDIRLLP